MSVRYDVQYGGIASKSTGACFCPPVHLLTGTFQDLTGAWMVPEGNITTPTGEQIFYLMGEEASVARARDRIVAAAKAVHDVMSSKAYAKTGAPEFRGISKLT